MQHAISWMTFFNISPHQPHAILGHFFPLAYSCYSLILGPQTKRFLSALSLIHVHWHLLSFNVNIAQTDFPIPPLKQVHLRRGIH